MRLGISMPDRAKSGQYHAVPRRALNDKRQQGRANAMHLLPEYKINYLCGAPSLSHTS